MSDVVGRNSGNMPFNPQFCQAVTLFRRYLFAFYFILLGYAVVQECV